MDALNKLIANKGGKVVNDTTEYVADCEGYYIASDIVVDRIEVDGDTATDVKADYFTTVANGGKGGILLRPNNLAGHEYFSAITLASGSVYPIHK